MFFCPAKKDAYILRSKKAFTLIEMLVVIVIIGILITAAMVLLNRSRSKSRDAKRVSDISTIVTALEIYNQDEGAYPAAITPGQAFVGPTSGLTYIKSVPSNPSPRTDGSCANTDYTYSAAADRRTYTLTYCLGAPAGDAVTGTNTAANGAVLSVTAWACGDVLTDSRDNNTYTTILIGTQCWLKQNLNVGTKITATSNQGSDCVAAADVEKYCYSNNEANCATDGALYQWAQAMCGAASCNGSGESSPACSTPVQGICPSGWHIPSGDEWTKLERQICTDNGEVNCATEFPYNETLPGARRGNSEGSDLANDITGVAWNTSNLKSHANFGLSGFNVGPVGWYNIANTTFYSRNVYSGFWSSLENGTSAWMRIGLDSGYTAVYRTSQSKLRAFPVRCLKD